MLTALLLAGGLAAQAADTPAPTDTQRALYDVLKLRHAPADLCDQLAAQTDDLARDVSFLLDHATQPAWVGTRAAGCLLDAAPTQGVALARTWMVREDRRGLAILTLNKLDALPEPAAVELAQLARRGVLGDDAVPRLRRLATPAVVAVADQPLDALPPLPDDLRADAP